MPKAAFNRLQSIRRLKCSCKAIARKYSGPTATTTSSRCNCHAHLDQDVGECLPYLNAELGGFEYIDDPRSVTFRSQGKIITVHPRMIAVNALKDASDADKILEWLKNEINRRLGAPG